MNEWQLILDLSDDPAEAGGDASLGEEKITNLVTAAALEQVVAYDDGYENREPGDFDSHDVILENPLIILSQPGEGLGHVTLREVT